MSAAEMVVLHGGIVAPISNFQLATRGGRGRFDSGVYAADGTVCPHGLQEKQSYDNVPAPLDLSLVSTVVPGSHVFGGLMQTGHFGHFVAESLTRLWAIRYLGGVSSVVFYARRTGAVMPNYAKELFRLLEVESPIKLVERPTAFERLVVPRQVARPTSAFIWGNQPTLELLAPLHRVAPAPHDKVYVSRAGLGAKGGGFLFEVDIERRLSEQGYFIFRPESASLEEQFAVYNGASKLIFADGSAVHVYAFVARADQNVAIIWRRNPSEFFLQQVTSFGGNRPSGISAIVQIWSPEKSFGAAVLSKAQLDMPLLFDSLRDQGFVSGPAWPEDDEVAVRAELDRIAAQTGWRYSANAQA